MIDLTLRDCVEFQEVFWHEGKYSPYEKVVKPLEYFVMATIGEIGSLINNYCKQTRSPNDYSKKIENECADIFIYLLTYILIVQKKKSLQLLESVEKNWSSPALNLKSEDLDYRLISLIEKVSFLLKPGYEKHLTSDYFLELFEMIKSISYYLTGESWQEIINEFHLSTFETHTDFNNYTPDLMYRGSSYINFANLISWAEKVKIKFPEKRKMFLQRMSKLQNS